MKTTIKAFRLLTLCAAMLVTTQLFAKNEDDRVEKTKSYSKSYTVSSSDNINIDNRFGETRLETWSNSEIKVEVQIKVKASSDERAQSLLNGITIEDGKTGSGVYYKTHIESNDNGRKGRNDNTEMHVDYIVHLPANNPLNLDTQFGDTYMPDYNGPVDISNKFGSLTAGKLNNVKELNVEFGKADIQAVNNGKLTIKYSTFTLGKLSGNIEARLEFCDGGKITVDNSVKSLEVFNNYSSLKLSTSKDFSANFDVQTHFGDFSNKTDFSIKEDSDKNGEWRSPKFDFHYTGKSGGGSTMVKIKSNFGNTTIM